MPGSQEPQYASRAAGEDGVPGVGQPFALRFSPIWARLEQVLFPAWEDPGGLDLRRLVDQSKQQLAGVSRADALVHEALSRASSLTEERLSLFAYPAIYTPEDSEGIQSYSPPTVDHGLAPTQPLRGHLPPVL